MRGAMLPGVTDPEWDRLASYRAFERETQRTVRMLRLERQPASERHSRRGQGWTRVDG